MDQDYFINKYYDTWRNHFKGTLREDEIIPENISKGWGRYECPCGGDDHWAVRRHYPDDGDASPILNCFETDSQWFILQPKGIDSKEIAGIIESEETKYLKLLEKSGTTIEKITKKMGKTEEAIKYLYDTHGVPEDVVRDYWL